MDRPIGADVRRRRRLRRLSGWALAVAAVAVVLVALPGWLRPSIPRSRIRTGRVERRAVEATLEASGTVVPASERVLSSPVETRVVRILRRAGTPVHVGDPVLELDTSATRLELDRLLERLAQKKSEEKRLRLSLERDLAELRARARSRRLDAEVLDYRVQQRRRLRTEGLISEEALKEIEAESEKARIEVEQLEESARNAERTAEAQVDELALGLRILDKEIVESRRTLDLATARADLDGVLTWVVPEEGAAVRRGDVIARIARLDAFRVDATISDVHAARLTAGLPVRVVTGERILPGRLATVLPAIESGAARFTVDLDDPSDRALRQNLRVDVHVIAETRPGALAVPTGAFATSGSVAEIFVVEGGEARRRKVRLGLGGLDRHEVLEGLEEGEEVILSDMRDYLHLERLRVK
jgi:HlyD family secretion protein